ncbi:MAG: hypothetical protein MJ075_04185 [Oscillospiraceae bacterium]|nr:hypothetical protein [Oscillospiraceae bacterium]
MSEQIHCEGICFDLPDGFKRLTKDEAKVIGARGASDSLVFWDKSRQLLLEVSAKKLSLLSKAVPLQSLVNNAAKAQLEAVPTAENVSDLVGTVGGVEAGGFQYDSCSRGMECRTEYTCFKHDKLIYAIVFSCPKDDFNKSSSLLEEIKESVRRF